MGYITVYTETGFELQQSDGTVVYSYASDEEGNLTETVNALTFRYSFDSNSNTTAVTDGNSTSLLSVSSAYDALNRLYNKTITSGYVTLSKGYRYASGSNGTGSLVSNYSTYYVVRDIQTTLSFSYTYDGNGNITAVTQTEQCGPVMTIDDPDPGPDYDVSVTSLDEGVSTASETSTSTTYRTFYSYDEAGQLVEAIDGETGLIYRYSYDSSGNIVSMNTYETDDSGSEVLVSSKTFAYTDGILTSYTDGATTVRCYSDSAGNLTRAVGGNDSKVLTWGEGRNLMGVQKSATNYTEYAYNVDGLRTQKTVVEGGISSVTQYIWGNNGLAAVITGDTTVVPIYDSDGEVVGFFVEETEEYTPAIQDVVTQKVYTYVKNLQGDVIRILDENGNTVVSYTYDPWGVPTVTGDADLAALNPCSYRGYDYDEETGYYYLQSRYYDPETGRFLNTDTYEYLGVGNSPVACNLYSYCCNSPIIFADHTGHSITLVILGTTIVIDAVMVYIACIFVLVPLLFQLIRDLPRIVYAIGEMVDDLFDALAYVLDKALSAYKRFGKNNHHIIAKAAPAASIARNIWTDVCDMDINNWRNIARIKTTLHVFLHTGGYYAAVNALVQEGYDLGGKRGVLRTVDFIRTILLTLSEFYF